MLGMETTMNEATATEAVEQFGAAMQRRMLLMDTARELIRMQDVDGFEGISPELGAVVGYFSNLSGFTPERIVADFRAIHA